MTKGLVRSCIKKAKLFKQFKLNPNICNRTKYNIYKNKLQKLLKKAETQYYIDKFEFVKTNIKHTWSLIKTVLNNNNKTDLFDSIKVNNKTVNDKQQIANEFNKYFVNIGPNLAQSLPNTPNIPSYHSYLKGDFVNSFSLFLTTPDEICRVVAAMTPKTSAGHDDISTQVMKIAITYIAPQLCDIINSSFALGIVPDQMKIAKVYPLFKSGDRSLSVVWSISQIIVLLHRRWEKRM